MSELLEAFVLGNGAILGNVCMLPLYPGLLAFLAGNANRERSGHATVWLGVLVLSGVLCLMLLVGLGLYMLKQSFSALLPILLPAVYGVVIVLGWFMLLGRNPFAHLSSMSAPVLSNPYASAFVYGLLLGPMTLPCTGPLVVSAFVLSAGSIGSLADGLLYFLAFGIGFGWPLILLPLLALPAQRQMTRWLAQQHQLLANISGVLLLGIGLFGIWTEVLPNW